MPKIDTLWRKNLRWPSALAILLLAILLLVTLSTSAVLWARHRDHVDNGAVAIAVAREEAGNFFSLDHRTAEDDADRVLKLATGTFKKEYAAQRDNVVAQVKAKKLVATASVPEDGGAVEELHEDRAKVLVAVDVTTEARSGNTGQSRYRTRIELTRVDGTWLVSGVEQVGADHDYRVGTVPGDHAQTAVKKAAEAIPLALSYDFRTLDEGLDQATAQMTGSFGKEFRATFEKTARPMATEKKAVASAVVTGAGLVRLDGDDRALCLVFVDQTLVSSTTMKNTKAPVGASQSRLLVELRRVDDTWEVDSIEPF